MYRTVCQVVGKIPITFYLARLVDEIPPTVVASGTSTPFSRKSAIPSRESGYAGERGKGSEIRVKRVFSECVDEGGEFCPDFGRSLTRSPDSLVSASPWQAGHYRKLRTLSFLAIAIGHRSPTRNPSSFAVNSTACCCTHTYTHTYVRYREYDRACAYDTWIPD